MKSHRKHFYKEYTLLKKSTNKICRSSHFQKFCFGEIHKVMKYHNLMAIITSITFETHIQSNDY